MSPGYVVSALIGTDAASAKESVTGCMATLEASVVQYAATTAENSWTGTAWTAVARPLYCVSGTTAAPCELRRSPDLDQRLTRTGLRHICFNLFKLWSLSVAQ